MSWDRTFDRMLADRDRSRVVIRATISLGAAVAAAMAMDDSIKSIVRDMSHPKNIAKETPRGPKQRFRKGR